MKTLTLGLLTAAALIWGALLQGLSLQGAEPGKLSFATRDNKEFTFDTGVLRGKLRADGKSTGLSSVVHVPSGTRLDRSMGLFGHYRVFSANHRYGTAAWDWPSQAKLTPDGAVEVRWSAAPERLFELRALYRWSAPDMLDLETIVEANTNLNRFESFLASYFAEGFTNACAYVKTAPEAGGKKGFMAAERSAGTWLAFPRDEAAVAIIQDGRWKWEPNPVDWTILPPLAAPLCFRRASANGLTAVLMSRPQDCFAVLTPFQAEPHYSMYLSLFGRDLKAGETAHARARLVIGQQLSEEAMLALFGRFSPAGR